MKKASVLFLCLLPFFKSFSQHLHLDSAKTKQIEGVIIINTRNIPKTSEKPLATVDEYLEQSPIVNMVRRGAYAWEPLINNMTTERTITTIDGMRIFGACTDKMDPVTSYVEISNLSKAEVSSGQQGACHGTTIGGAIDLVRAKSSFGEKKWNFGVNSGFETVNLQKIFGTSANFKSKKFYIDTDFMMRNADNYKDGHGNEIAFSQFHKFNISEITGVKLADNQLLEASVIYDKATDVGYPALPMDVSLAEAIIMSLKFEILPKSDIFKGWETKIYYNRITHRMDDTKRPNVAMHMDMPGFSKTFGYFSKLKFEKDNNHILLNINGFYNNSLAEMTMYPNNSAENPMFMLTWPDINTLYQGIYLEDVLKMNEKSQVKFSASVGFHRNSVESKFGLSSLQIFYPVMSSEKNRFLKSLSGNYEFHQNHWRAGIGFAYGQRAPSVSEGYGFYLFNSFDRYDYIGNTDLKNETSLEGNVFVRFKTQKFIVKASSSYFHIQNYIVGKRISNLIPMTLGANGVKAYQSLNYVTIFNANMETETQISNLFNWKAQIGYNRGKDDTGVNLPFMSPISYRSALTYEKKRLSGEVSILGNLKNRNFSASYGETKTPDYTIVNANVGYRFAFDATKIIIKIGIENAFDKFYTTYSDWNRIPRPGRNYFLNMNFSF